jgi:hypothetical protein
MNKVGSKYSVQAIFQYNSHEKSAHYTVHHYEINGQVKARNQAIQGAPSRIMPNEQARLGCKS